MRKARRDLSRFARQHYRVDEIAPLEDFKHDLRNLTDTVKLSATRPPGWLPLYLNRCIIALNLWGQAAGNRLLFLAHPASAWPQVKTCLVHINSLEPIIPDVFGWDIQTASISSDREIQHELQAYPAFRRYDAR